MLTRRDTLVGGLCALAFPRIEAALAAQLSYALSAREVAPGTYVVIGKREYFTMANGGDIVNVAFVDTKDGAVVIDTGSSKRYGLALRQLVERTIGKDIVRVYNTHHHPDHFLGNQAFDPGVIASTEQVTKNIDAEGEMLAENLYRLLGDWMRGTHAVTPGVVVADGEEKIGDHRFELIGLKGHTSSDLVILDKSTGILFAGDLAFLDRAATTPHASISDWQESLDALSKVPHKVLIPGHGEPDGEGRAIDQTRDYLAWLSRTLEQAVKNGLDMTEVMSIQIPERFQSVALAREELERSVAHLYPGLEDRLLPYIGQGESQAL
ncbi:MAG: quinoprotein relay system zinc metallohydrolase 1 [Methyloceanibacter sp.]|jgi:uncharacterized sulfatase